MKIDEKAIRGAAVIFFLTVVFVPAFFPELIKLTKPDDPHGQQTQEQIYENVTNSLDIVKWGRRIAGALGIIVAILGFREYIKRKSSDFL